MNRIRLASLILLVTVLALMPIPTRAVAPTTDLVIQVYGDQPVNVYDRASASGSILGTATTGARMLWNGITQQSENRNWIQVTYLGAAGWASPDTNAVYQIDPSRITEGIDRSAVVQPSARTLNVYQAPAVSSGVVSQLPVGAQLTVTDGPVTADLYTWWQIKVNGQSNVAGWIPDTVDNLQTVTPLQVYGINVCDGFNLKTYGVAGWDSIVQSLPSLVPEKILCLASSNLAGTNTPFVIVLSRVQGQLDNETRDTLHIFQPDGQAWFKIYEQTTDDFVRTADLRLHDLTNDGKPAILWTTVNDGTGHVMNVRVLRYHPVAGVQPILTTIGLYKGSVQMSGTGSIVLLQADYAANEPNCCPSGIERWGYVWQNNEFVQTVNDKLKNPGALQGFPNQ